MNPNNIITKFLLLFCKKRYQIQYGLYDKRVEYKRLFRKMYVLGERELTPGDFVERLVIEKAKQTKWVEAPE